MSSAGLDYSLFFNTRAFKHVFYPPQDIVRTTGSQESLGRGGEQGRVAEEMLPLSLSLITLSCRVCGAKRLDLMILNSHLVPSTGTESWRWNCAASSTWTEIQPLWMWVQVQDLAVKFLPTENEEEVHISRCKFFFRECGAFFSTWIRTLNQYIGT